MKKDRVCNSHADHAPVGSLSLSATHLSLIFTLAIPTPSVGDIPLHRLHARLVSGECRLTGYPPADWAQNGSARPRTSDCRCNLGAYSLERRLLGSENLCEIDP